MSVINQALKKAQRQQVGHSTPPSLVPFPRRFASPRRRLHVWWRGGLICAIVLCSGGAVLYSWPPRSALPPQAVVQGAPGGLVATVPPASLPKALAVLPVQEVPMPQHLASEVVREASVALSSTPPAGASPGGTGVSPRQAMAVPPLPDTAVPRHISEGRPVQSQVATIAPAGRVSAEELLPQALRQQEAGNVSQARLLFEQIVALDPTAKVAYNSLGNLYYQQEQYARAATMYEQALAIDPGYVKARNNLGNTYMRLRMDHRALAELQQALNIDGTYGLTHYNLACFYARAGNGHAAARYLQQAIDREPQARDWAQNDTDFRRVRSTPEIASLLGGVR